MRTPVYQLLGIVVLLLSVGANATELTTKCANGLLVSAKVDPVVRDFSLGNKLPHLNATVRLTNDLQATATFSTARLLLSAESAPPKRAYVNSIASQVADFSDIDVNKGQFIELNVYWPVSLEIGVTVERLLLSCAG